MNRGSYRGTIVLLIVTLVVALAILAIAEDSEATITGDQPPTWGSDWEIYQNTVATGETIRLDGYIYVWYGSTLSLDGCTIIFNDTWNPSNGILVDWGAILYMNNSGTTRTKVMGNETGDIWWFDNWGEVYMKGTDISGVYYGMYSDYASAMYIEDCTIDAIQRGVESYRTDTHVGNTTITVKSVDMTGNNHVYGVYVNNAVASLHNLDIQIDVRSNVTYNTSSYYGRNYVYGVYLSSAIVGDLAPDPHKEFKISITQDIAIHNYYETTYVYLRQYFYTRAVYISGNTICHSIKGLDISVDEQFHGATYNATRYGRVYMYYSQRYIYVQVSSNGKSPTEVSDMTFTGLGSRFSWGGTSNQQYEYYDSYVMYFNTHADSYETDDLLQFHDLTFSDSTVEFIIYPPTTVEWDMRDCSFSNLTSDRILYLSRTIEDWTIAFNTFTQLHPLFSSYLFYFYYADGEGNILNNTFTDIQCYKLMYWNFNQDRLFIEGNEFSDITQIEGNRNPLLHWDNNQEKATLSFNTFTNFEGFGLITVYANRARVQFENNLVENNLVSEYLMKTRFSVGEVEIVDNDFRYNEGPLFWFEDNRYRVAMEKNRISFNDAGADYLVYTYVSRSELKFLDNYIHNNTADGALLFFRGATYWSQIPFSFERNTINDNTASSAYNGGILVFRGARYDIAIRRNTFDGNVGNVINFYRPYSNYASNYNYDHIVDGNTFKNNEGTATLWVDYSTYNIQVKRNIGTNNAGPLMRHVITDHYVYDYFNPNLVGEVRGAANIAVDQNNYSYNRGGAVDIHGQWQDAYTPYSQVSQTISLKNNFFLYNGDDWAIQITDFGAFPQLHNNELFGSRWGTMLQAINYPALWPIKTMEFMNIHYDGGGPLGRTAWSLTHVNAVFTNCTFTNFRMTLFAKDCQIDVYWSAIAEASGRTEGRGYIFVYNHIEFLITWTDENGMDSGNPAVGAKLALLGSNGRYYGAMETNDMGRIGPLLIIPWSSIEGRTDSWTPYTGTILAGGLTSTHIVHAIGEQVGENSVHMTVKDIEAPEIVLTTPQGGSTSNKVDLPVEGFLFETGSGVGSFMGYLDGGDGVEIESAEIWSTIFMGLSPGQHSIYLEVIDVAGNAINTTVTFFIDSAPPVLTISEPTDGMSTRVKTLLIQGTFSDDVSDLSSIAVRINGEPYVGTPGTISINHELDEGVNTLIIDATDGAGNRVTERIRVTLDTNAPTLYVYSPLNDLYTANEMLTVSGLSEAGTPILIEMVSEETGALLSNDTVIAGMDGLFTFELKLEEGRQHIVVTAKDDADNVRTITRTVRLDTQPPGLFIDSPEDAETSVNTPTITLVGHIDDENPENIIVKVDGLLVQHMGVFSKIIPLDEGLNVIVVTATDPAGNSVTKSVNVTRDTTKPDLIVQTSGPILTKDKNLVVRGSVNADADSVKVAGDGVNIDEQMRFTKDIDLSEETSPIRIEAMDAAGNMAVYDIEFVYDPDKPELNLDQTPAQTDRLVLYLNGSVEDTLAVVEQVEVQSVMYPVVDTRFSVFVQLSTGNEGWNNFTVKAYDDAGNVATQKVNVQYIPPPVVDIEEDDKTSGDALSWLGLLFIVAAVVLIATVFVFARKNQEVRS